MDPGRFFASSRVLIVAGKGGTGKTALSAACATAAARLGLSVVLVEVGGRSAAAPMLGIDAVGYQEAAARPDLAGVDLKARSIGPDEALVEWLGRHGFERIVKRMARSGLLEVVATATPGIKDLLVLGRVRNLEEAGGDDLIVVDAPASGQAVGLLRAPAAIAASARSGVLHRQALAALDMLGDARRCRAMLVTVAEETPVNELIETALAVEDEVGVALAPVVVNAVLDEIAGLDVDIDSSGAAAGLTAGERADLRAAAELRSSRWVRQEACAAELARRLPAPQLRLPRLPAAELGPPGIDRLADALTAGIDALPEPSTS